MLSCDGEVVSGLFCLSLSEQVGHPQKNGMQPSRLQRQQVGQEEASAKVVSFISRRSFFCICLCFASAPFVFFVCFCLYVMSFCAFFQHCVRLLFLFVYALVFLSSCLPVCFAILFVCLLPFFVFFFVYFNVSFSSLFFTVEYIYIFWLLVWPFSSIFVVGVACCVFSSAICLFCCLFSFFSRGPSESIVSLLFSSPCFS